MTSALFSADFHSKSVLIAISVCYGSFQTVTVIMDLVFVILQMCTMFVCFV